MPTDGNLILPDFVDNLDMELDFDLSDFNFIDMDTDEQKEQDDELTAPGIEQGRILKPRMSLKSISHKLTFANARAFARQIDLDSDRRTFAWVDGSFVFGDVIEALCFERHMIPEEIYISSLSINQENIDSLKNILLMGSVKKLIIVLSAYFYSHEKYDLVPYLYQELDIDDILQVCFINSHAKITAIKTRPGNTLTMHGSANLRSSNSIEQIMIERDPDLFEYNARIMQDLADIYGTIDHSVPRTQPASAKRKKSRYNMQYYTGADKTYETVERASNQTNQDSISKAKE